MNVNILEFITELSNDNNSLKNFLNLNRLAIAHSVFFIFVLFLNSLITSLYLTVSSLILLTVFWVVLSIVNVLSLFCMLKTFYKLRLPYKDIGGKNSKLFFVFFKEFFKSHLSHEATEDRRNLNYLYALFNQYSFTELNNTVCKSNHLYFRQTISMLVRMKFLIFSSKEISLCQQHFQVKYIYNYLNLFMSEFHFSEFYNVKLETIKKNKRCIEMNNKLKGFGYE